MAQARETAFNPPSPHSSSGGADSYKHEGTPDTRLTAFSPDDNPSRSAGLLKALNLVTAESHQNRFQVNPTEAYTGASTAVEKDPFVSTTTAASKTEQKLSPTASSFRPVSTPLVAHGSLNGASFGTGPSGRYSVIIDQAPSKLSADLGISRYLVISSTSGVVTAHDVEDYIERIGYQPQGKRSILLNASKVYLRLTNIRDARNIHDNIRLSGADWLAEYISSAEFYNVSTPVKLVIYIDSIVRDFVRSEGDIFGFQRQSGLQDPVYRAVVEFCDVDVAAFVISKFNGIVFSGMQLLLAPCEPAAPPVATSLAHEHLERYALPQHSVEDLASMFHGVNVSKPTHPEEFSSIHLGQSPALAHMPQHPIPMYPLVYHGPAASPVRYVLDQTPTRSQSASSLTPMTPMSGGVPIMTPIFTPPKTPMAFQNEYANQRAMAAFGRHDGRYDGRRQNAMRVNRSPFYNAAGHHNHVDVTRIRDGIDVRTTIMLRNIPNKVDQTMLKKIVDESSWGKYDFMYLRIDFANDCNVGYAFINFVDVSFCPLSCNAKLINQLSSLLTSLMFFVNARGNQRWNCFKSDKVAEISYATIQGKDCLVQKFRNSSVMLEMPHYRPKLYYTINGPRAELAGQEEPFPEPDNQSKMKRSCENAEHVGLFTPNAGQHFRDEQRRRRSQYDRGTRLAALEEFDYDAQMPQQVLYNPH
ncbi:hypothetical protein B0H67DRAFT_493421 [Lasiosphaeris hirsuta]|uniref:Mei2-like C-terminal RNA recognition motif domain-containing protein n=1 Tax=Lasiosphaeris hirsuta TaxID=260670 RepID=A0AA40A845_9PEZI|nr:hypothetical protein B0H67DRAFT_493421 [Lasiosphaeris hirsuta]